MVTKTLHVNRMCAEGHRWQDEMTITELRELLRTKQYHLGCPECRYVDVNMLPTKKLQQALNNESH